MMTVIAKHLTVPTTTPMIKKLKDMVEAMISMITLTLMTIKLLLLKRNLKTSQRISILEDQAITKKLRKNLLTTCQVKMNQKVRRMISVTIFQMMVMLKDYTDKMPEVKDNVIQNQVIKDNLK